MFNAYPDEMDLIMETPDDIREMLEAYSRMRR